MRLVLAKVPSAEIRTGEAAASDSEVQRATVGTTRLAVLNFENVLGRAIQLQCRRLLDRGLKIFRAVQDRAAAHNDGSRNDECQNLH